MTNKDGGSMNKEQIAEQIADQIYKSPGYCSGYGYESLRDAALSALEHQEKRIAELEAELIRANDLLMEIGEYRD